MDLRQLKYFVAVARERNFTRAAEQLHMAQPPLGRQIQLLEEELGVPLLLRNSRPLRLTEAGRFLFEQAVQVLSRVEQMTAETRRLGLNQQGTLSIGFVPSTLYGGVPILLRKLRQQHPKLDIRLVELSSIQQVEALRTGRIDLGFGRIPSNDRAVTRIVLREERLVLAMPSTSPGAAKPQPMWLSELAEQKLIVYPKNPRPSFADQAQRGLQFVDLDDLGGLHAAAVDQRQDLVGKAGPGILRVDDELLLRQLRQPHGLGLGRTR